MDDHEPSRWKIDLVAETTDEMSRSPVIGLVSISGVPAPQLQKMRARLRGHISMKVMKNTLLEIALRETSKEKKGLDKLVSAIDGQMALMLSDSNPFRLYKLLVETRTKMPAKGGEIAPEDIEIKAGDTPFKPGPIVSDLQKAGIPAAIEQGKVVVKKDKLLVKQGEIIKREVALALTKLEIYPLTVGLELMAAYEDGIVFEKEMLAVDQSAYIANLQRAAKNMLNLSVFATILNRTSIIPLMAKAHGSAFNLAVNAELLEPEVIRVLMAKANSQCLSLASRLPPESLDEQVIAQLSGAQGAQREDVEDKDYVDEEKKDGDDEKKDEEKKVSDEEAAAGLSALFG